MPSQPSVPRLSPDMSVLDFEAIGTHWKIDLGDVSSSQLRKLSGLIADRINEFDKDYSRFRHDSLVAKMSKQAGRYKLPDDAQPMLDFYKQLYDLSGGLVTPLIGDLLVAAGYDPDYSLKPKKLSRPARWEDVLKYDFPDLEIAKPVVLDFGAAGKGYLVDIVRKILVDEGVETFVINAGGDIFCQGADKVQVALEHPDHPSLAVGVAQILNQSICGSAGNRRQWQGFHHVIDPEKLSSPEHIKALWVVADNAMVADGLTTLLYFVKPELLNAHFQFEYAIVNSDMSLNYSSAFPAEFF